MPSLKYQGKAFVHAHHRAGPFRALVPDAAKSCLPKDATPSRQGSSGI